MLTIIDIPQEISNLYAQSKEIALQITNAVSESATSQHLKRNSSLTENFDSSIIIIQKGMLKYFYNEKFIRFYSNGDILIIPSKKIPLPIAVTAEFAAEVLIITSDRFNKVLGNNTSLIDKWLTYQAMSDSIHHGLTSLFAGEDFKPEIDIRQFSHGDIIINEGDAPDNLFEMIEGKALVSVQGTQVGAINQGEVFGEVSFLTQSKRTATVTAQSQCIVQVISGNQFEKIIKYRPTLVHSVSKTLAQRLTEVNERLIRISTLT